MATTASKVHLTRNVNAVAFDDVDEILESGVRLTDRDVARVQPVLGQHGLDLVGVDVRERDRIGKGNLRKEVHERCSRMSPCRLYGTHSAALLLLDCDLRRLLVETNAEALEFSLDDGEVTQRLQDVQHDEDELGGERR